MQPLSKAEEDSVTGGMSVSRTFLVRLWFMAPCLPTQYTEHAGDRLLNSRELKSKVSSICVFFGLSIR